MPAPPRHTHTHAHASKLTVRVALASFAARQVRWYLAALGCTSLDEAVGLGKQLLRTKAEAAATPKGAAFTTAFLTDLPS